VSVSGWLVDFIEQSVKTVHKGIEFRSEIQEDGTTLLDTVRWKGLHLP